MKYPEFEKTISNIIHDITEEKDFYEVVRDTEEKRVISMTHSNYGQYIRNSYSLWEDSALTKEMRDMGFTHADDMSSTLIKCAIRDIKGEPREIEKEIQHYKEFWKNIVSVTK